MVRKVSIIEKSLTSIRIATGTATFEEKKAVEKDIRRNKVEEVKKVEEEKAKQSEKKAKPTWAQIAKKEEKGKKVVKEDNIKSVETKKELVELTKKLPELVEDGETFAKVAQDIVALSKMAKEDEQTANWGMTEEKAKQETQAWSKVGTKRRYVDIATAFYEDVRTNPNDGRYKKKMVQVNEILEKLTSAEGGVKPIWRLVKVEPIPQISLREVRWRVPYS